MNEVASRQGGEAARDGQSSPPSPALAGTRLAASPPVKYALSLDHLAWTRGDAAGAVAETVAYARLADEIERGDPFPMHDGTDGVASRTGDERPGGVIQYYYPKRP